MAHGARLVSRAPHAGVSIRHRYNAASRHRGLAAETCGEVGHAAGEVAHAEGEPGRRGLLAAGAIVSMVAAAVSVTTTATAAAAAAAAAALLIAVARRLGSVAAALVRLHAATDSLGRDAGADLDIWFLDGHPALNGLAPAASVRRS